jgi:hypothetical protein
MIRDLKKVFLTTVLAATGLLGGCAAIGPTDDPFLRGLTWERYIGGDDLDRACAAGQPERFRLVYNAVEKEQRRTYDITGQADGGALVETRVIGRPVLNDPRNPITLRDPLGPWRGQTSLHRISAAELDGVVAALDTSGFDGPAPDGLFLRADGLFWTASACRNGQFHFYAWSGEEAGFKPVGERLLAAILPYDDTGVPAIHPYDVPLPPYGSYFAAAGRDVQPQYTPERYQVGKNGLRYSQGTIN